MVIGLPSMAADYVEPSTNVQYVQRYEKELTSSIRASEEYTKITKRNSWSMGGVLDVIEIEARGKEEVVGDVTML
jgi:translation initiation factor 2B subunit (eIF-2B alpha/beta/delta family)